MTLEEAAISRAWRFLAGFHPDPSHWLWSEAHHQGWWFYRDTQCLEKSVYEAADVAKWSDTFQEVPLNDFLSIPPLFEEGL